MAISKAAYVEVGPESETARTRHEQQAAEMSSGDYKSGGTQGAVELMDRHCDPMELEGKRASNTR